MALAERTIQAAARRAHQVGPALFDQVLSSGTQLIAAALIARVSSAELFGAASAMLLLHGLLIGTVRALVGDVVLLRLRRSGADHRHEARLGLALAGTVGLAYAAALAVAAGLTRGDLRDLLLVLVVVVPFGACQDVLRSVAYGRRRVIDAVWLDGTWMAVQVVASAVLYATDRATAASLLLAWGAGAVVSGLGGVLVTRLAPTVQGIRTWLREDGRRSVSFLADYTVNSGVLIVADLLLGLILPPAEYGALRLARLGVSPLVNIIGGVRALMLGRLAEVADDRPTVRRSAVGFGRTLALAMVVYGLVVTLMPTSFGELVFGATWASARAYVGVMALGEGVRFASIPAVDVVRVCGSPGRLVSTRVWTSVLQAGVALLAGAAFGAAGAVWGTLVIAIVSARAWWALALRLTAAPRSAASSV